MCIFTEILGGGPALVFQLITFSSILVATGAWVWLFISRGLGNQLRLLALPAILWFAFGSLDIVITARGTYDNPMRESNPAARLLFLQFGNWGPPIASVLWVCLWAALIYAVNTVKPGRVAEFLSLGALYSLAVGHFFAFSGWFVPLCALKRDSAINWIYPAGIGGWKILAMGVILAGLHMLASGALRGAGKPNNPS